MRDFKKAGIPEMQLIDISELRSGLLFTSSVLSIIGFLTLVAGIGLFLVRGWARKLCLGIATFLVPVYFYWSYSHYVRGYSITEDVIELIVALLIAIVSWKYLTKNSVKKLFRDEKQEAAANI